MIDGRIDRIGGRPFRSSFHRLGRDRGPAQLHGPARLRELAGNP